MSTLLIVISIGAVGLILLLHFLSPKKQDFHPDIPQLKVQEKIHQAKTRKKDVGFTPTHVENMMRELEEDRDIY